MTFPKDIVIQRSETKNAVRIEWIMANGQVLLMWSYECETCSGYGSPCSGCDGTGRKIEELRSEELYRLLGPEQYKEMARLLYSAIMSPIKDRRFDWRAEGCEDHSCANCWDCEIYMADNANGIEHRCTNPRNKRI